ncbi:hypothetical protein BH11PAT1_BH11PAT1_3260 [soil metagenome]
MDQKQLSQLDPKLKAVYDRVMGVANTAPLPPVEHSTPPPPPAAAPLTSPHMVTEEVTRPIAQSQPGSIPSMPPPPLNPPQFPPQAPIPTLRTDTPQQHDQPMQQVYSTMPLDPMSTPIVNQTGSSKTFMILFIVLGIIFFILYGVFWVQLFHIGLPGISSN